MTFTTHWEVCSEFCEVACSAREALTPGGETRPGVVAGEADVAPSWLQRWELAAARDTCHRPPIDCNPVLGLLVRTGALQCIL